MIFAGVTRDIADILVRFGGNKNSVLPEHVYVRRKLPFFPEQPLEDMQHERHPARRGLDKAKSELRVLLGDLIGDQIAERKQRLHAAVTERVVPLDIE